MNEARAQVTRFLEAGNADAAMQMLEKVRAEEPNAQLSAAELKRAIKALLKQKNWKHAKAAFS